MRRSLRSTSKVVTVMLIDIVGYTNLSTKISRKQFEDLDDNFNNLAVPIFKEYGGWIVKKLGDSFLVVFESATDSLLCSMDMQNAFRDYNETKPEIPIKIKVALNSGEVVIKDNDVYGETVNTVARIEKETKSGQILFSHSTFLSMNKGEIPHAYVGTKRMKGLKYPVRLFRIKGAGEDEHKRQVHLKKERGSLVRNLVILAIIVIAGYYSYPYISEFIKNLF